MTATSSIRRAEQHNLSIFSMLVPSICHISRSLYKVDGNAGLPIDTSRVVPHSFPSLHHNRLSFLTAMKFLTLLSAISALVPAILAGPAGIAVNIDLHPGETSGRHIVTLKEGVARAPILTKVTSLLAGKPGKGITHEYDAVFNGFAGEFTSPSSLSHLYQFARLGDFDSVTLAALQLMPGVEAISEDGVMHTFATQYVW